jgi:hypothetical protein
MSGGPIARNPSPHPAGGHGFDSADDGRRSGRRHRSASAQVVGLFRQLVPHQCTPALSRALSSASLTKRRPRQHCCHSCWSKIAAKGVQRVDGLSRETWRAMVADSFSHCRLRRPRGGRATNARRRGPYLRGGFRECRCGGLVVVNGAAVVFARFPYFRISQSGRVGVDPVSRSSSQCSTGRPAPASRWS